MVALKRSDFHTALDDNINKYAKDQVDWHRGNPRSADYMNQAPLANLSDFNRVYGVDAGNADASSVVAVIKAEATRCSAIRKVYTARYYSGSNYTDGYRGTSIGIAALNSDYRRSIYSMDTAEGWPYYVSTNRNADLSNLADLINAAKDELYNLIHNTPSVDLSVCHTSCHGNCHTSRNRR